MTAEFPVVHLKIRHRATRLTPPAVATQDLLAQTFVRQGIQPLETEGTGWAFSYFVVTGRVEGEQPMHSARRYRVSRGLVPKRSELLKDAELPITGGPLQVCAHALFVLLQ